MLVVAAILGAVFLLVRPAVPTAMKVSYRLPDEVRALALEYRQAGVVVRAARFTWAGDSPAVLRHEPQLVAGTYEIVAELRAEGGATTRVRRTAALDGERLARVDLRPASERL